MKKCKNSRQKFRQIPEKCDRNELSFYIFTAIAPKKMILKACKRRIPSANRKDRGEVTEWTIVPASKSGVPQGTGGSNPSFSASDFDENEFFRG